MAPTRRRRALRRLNACVADKYNYVTAQFVREPQVRPHVGVGDASSLTSSPQHTLVGVEFSDPVYAFEVLTNYPRSVYTWDRFCAVRRWSVRRRTLRAAQRFASRQGDGTYFGVLDPGLVWFRVFVVGRAIAPDTSRRSGAAADVSVAGLPRRQFGQSAEDVGLEGWRRCVALLWARASQPRCSRVPSSWRSSPASGSTIRSSRITTTRRTAVGE